jgi:hypothetical protein
MQDDGRIEAAKHAARICINLLDEAARFCVIAFNHEARVLVPLSPATYQNKERAHREIRRLSGDGGTVFSAALLATREELLKLKEGIRYALFLTDGENDPKDKNELRRAVDRCKGLFQCDGRGVGADWTKADLTFIANTLLGNADIIPSPEMMEAAFREAITAALAKGVADVRLRLWSPKTVTMATIKQVSPEIVDLGPLKVRKDEKTIEVPTGAWADESRDYHLTLTFAPGEIGDERGLRTVLRAVRLTVLRGASAAITRNTDGAAQVLKLAATRCNAANDVMCHEPTSRPLSEAQKFD